MANAEERIEFSSGDLRLEGMLHRAESPRFVGVVLHPHPLYGGDMDNHVVKALCDAMRGLGAATLRFNFRGAGDSEGDHDNGRGECDDAIAAISVLRENIGAVPLVLAGYSFGAMIAASVARDECPAGLILVSPPIAVASASPLPDEVAALIITGTDDHVAPPEAVGALHSPRHSFIVVEGADHSWWGRTRELHDAVIRLVSSEVLSH